MNLLLPGIASLQNLALALLQASLTSSALVVLLLLAKRWGKGTLPVRWLYGLALLAMALLALPVLPESDYGLRWQAVPALPPRAVQLTQTSADPIPAKPTPLPPHGLDESIGSVKQNPEVSLLPTETRPMLPEPGAAESGRRAVVPFSNPGEPLPNRPAVPQVAAEDPMAQRHPGFSRNGVDLDCWHPHGPAPRGVANPAVPAKDPAACPSG